MKLDMNFSLIKFMKFKSMSINISSVFDELGVVLDFLENNIFKVQAMLNMLLFGKSLLFMFNQISQHI